MVEQCALHGEVAHLVAAGIEVEQAIEAHRLCRADKGAHGGVGLQAATGADAHHLQLAQLVLLVTGCEIDIRKSIDFIDYYIDIVATDAG